MRSKSDKLVGGGHRRRERRFVVRGEQLTKGADAIAIRTFNICPFQSKRTTSYNLYPSLRMMPGNDYRRYG